MADTQPQSFDTRFSALTTEDPALAEAKRRLGQGMAVQPQTPATRPALAPVENPQAPQLSTGMEPPPPPPLRNMPAPQPADDRNPLEVFDIFKNPAIVLAGIGSLFTRNSLTTAFNAGAGAINGFRSGQQQVFEQNKERWHQAATQALDQNQTEITKYKVAIEQREMKARMASMYALASQYNDPAINAFMRNGDIDGAYNMVMKREEIANDARKAFEVEKSKLKARQEIAGDEEAHIDAVGHYLAAPPVGSKQFTPEGREFMAKLYEKYPNYDYNKWLGSSAAAKVEGAADVKAEAASLTKQIAQKHAIDAFEANTAQQGRRLLDLAKRKDASGVPVVQGWVNAGMRATGDPLIAQFDAQMAVYRPEVGKILTNPNLAGVLTVHAQQEAESLIKGDITYESLKAVVNLLEQDFKTRSDTIDAEIAKTRQNLHGGGETTPDSHSGKVFGVPWSYKP